MGFYLSVQAQLCEDATTLVNQIWFQHWFSIWLNTKAQCLVLDRSNFSCLEGGLPLLRGSCMHTRMHSSLGLRAYQCPIQQDSTIALYQLVNRIHIHIAMCTPIAVWYNLVYAGPCRYKFVLHTNVFVYMVHQCVQYIGTVLLYWTFM